jgi:hypothetical protein
MASVVTSMWAITSCERMVLHRSAVLNRTIQRVMDICRRDNLQPPEHLVVQSDNTTSQANKNIETGMFLATIVAQKKFLSTPLNILIVGHTHEDIDQIFSVLLSLAVRRPSLFSQS